MTQIELILTPEEAAKPNLDVLLKARAAHELKLKPENITFIKKIRRSIDARSRQIKVLFLVEVHTEGEPELEPDFKSFLKPLFKNAESDLLKSNVRKAIIVGAGPAGYFAALELLEHGIKPIVFDRGKDVRERRKDLRAIQQFGIVNPHSNYCFGEGGAGTYSDGKLYTRSVKRGDVFKSLKILVEHGANPEILLDAHPHIGSNKLPKVVSALRETILENGGEVHFDSHVTDFILHDKKILGVVVNGETEHFADAVILATGHSARDIFELLFKKGIYIEAKPFAMGVRIEHPQALIDEAQYRQNPRSEHLPASSYKHVCQVDSRGVFSFCMCPGGLIVPAATAPGEIVVNGMSMSRRDSEFANSGIVVAVNLEDLEPFKNHGAFAGLEFQKTVEQAVFKANGDGSQRAPAQGMTDFVAGKISPTLRETSYIPGLVSAPVHNILPEYIAKRLRVAFVEFGKKMRGYYTEEANVVATESRTSSPIKIPRVKETLMHTEIENLFPCGEGAGYAGGIISAAMDGQNVAKAVALKINAG
jgi:uncharacterized FAD-dependent dehydrogenase